METINSIQLRRSIRKFKSDDIPKNIIEDIINCGILAPSAKNRQPWYFLILKGKKNDEIADLMRDYFYKHGGIEEQVKQRTFSSILETANVINQAPILILIFRPKQDSWIVSDNLSIGACVENMCLRATDLKIGSLWIRDVYCIAQKVESLYKKDEMELSCALALGVADQLPIQRPRKKLEDITEWYE